MDPLLILAAFAFGAGSSMIGLPPLVGYLVAGFVLNGLGISGGESLATIADAGVTLLLFTIGLKLKLKSLAKPKIWAGTSAHMLITIAVFGTGIYLAAASGIPHFQNFTWQTIMLVAFALSFSSTVFAVKVFEENNGLSSRHAVTAIGILIMQDIIAVVFLSASAGKMPSPWTLALIMLLVIARPILNRVMAQCGHGELLMLFGILMTAGGYSSFDLVGLKGDLGALIFGMLLASHPKASELSNRLLGFKDLFLVGFFLSIGISASPSLAGLLIALGLTLAMPFKSVLFFLIFTRFKLRSRTSLLASLSLSNYSEFGLIVGSIGVTMGWIGAEWLTIIAMALSITFILAAPLNSAAHDIYARFSRRLKTFETTDRLPEDRPVETGDASIAILGMGSLGSSAYDEMKLRYGNVVIGVDFCAEIVKGHQQIGRNVISGDAEDSDFWERVEPSAGQIDLVMLALPNPKSAIFAIQQMKKGGYQGQITASVRYEDEIPTLKQEGVDAVFSLYEEAGVGFANHVCNHLGFCNLNLPGPD